MEIKTITDVHDVCNHYDGPFSIAERIGFIKNELDPCRV